MANIDYAWNESEQDNKSLLNENIESNSGSEELSSRKNIQIMRRVFHMINGCAIATLYFISFSHSQMIHLLGVLVSALYIFEQIRINYPEKAAKFIPMTKFIIRAEEQLKESAMVPYGIAVLLTIITFPKPIALIGIYALAIADPMSAIIGIKFGKKEIIANRTVAGSSAFFFSTLLISLGVLSVYLDGLSFMTITVSLTLAAFCTAFEMIPLRIDDNISIPLFTATTLWIIALLFGLNL